MARPIVPENPESIAYEFWRTDELSQEQKYELDNKIKKGMLTKDRYKVFQFYFTT